MKVCIVLLVALGFIALSQAAPAVEEVALVEGDDSDKEAKMNELTDPNCGPKSGSEDSDSEQETAESKSGEKKKKGKRGGKGKKGGKGGKKDKKPEDEEAAAE